MGHKKLSPIPGDQVIARIAQALRHPLRVQILETLAGEPLSPSVFSRRSNAVLSTAAYHFRVLHIECAVIEEIATRQVRGTVETTYQLVPPSRIGMTLLSKLPPLLIAGVRGPMLEMLVQEAVAAMNVGAMDEHEDSALIYRPVALDSEGWRESSKAIQVAMAAIARAEEESRVRVRSDDSGETLRAIAGVALFKAEQPHCDDSL